MAVTSATTAASTSTAAAVNSTSKATIAQNFDSFLQLLTTQLKNQSPLDPLDTNQFTQQLVQFAQVEQQINMNSSLGTLISLQQTAQTTAAVGFLGSTVTVGGDTTKLADGTAKWSFSPAKAATATVTIKNDKGVTAYSGTFAVNAGSQQFSWDGRGNDGTQWPDGNYTISISAKDATGTSVAVSTEVTGVVDGIDVTQNPPLLSVGGQVFTIDQIKRVVRTTS